MHKEEQILNNEQSRLNLKQCLHMTNARCKSYSSPRPTFTTPCIPRSVTFYKLSAVACAESSCFWPEPEKDVNTDDELTPRSSFSCWQRKISTSFPHDSNSGFNNSKFDDAIELAQGPEEKKLCTSPKGSRSDVQHVDGQKKTLVLDLDGTLICATNSESTEKRANSKDCVNSSVISFLDLNGAVSELEFYVRPGAQSFIRALSSYYDIVVITPS